MEEAREQFRLGESPKDTGAIGFMRVGLHRRGNPAAPIGVEHVHELSADRPAVDPPPTLRVLPAGGLEIRMDERLDATERIEIGLQITPAPERVAHSLVRHHPLASIRCPRIVPSRDVILPTDVLEVLIAMR